MSQPTTPLSMAALGIFGIHRSVGRQHDDVNISAAGCWSVMAVLTAWRCLRSNGP